MTKIEEIIFGASLMLLVPTIIVKTIIHAALDIRNGHSPRFGSAWGHINFLPYDKEVAKRDAKLKCICNYLQKATIIFLAFFVVACILRFFVKEYKL